jgi:hypothetical protein
MRDRNAVPIALILTGLIWLLLTLLLGKGFNFSGFSFWSDRNATSGGTSTATLTSTTSGSAGSASSSNLCGEDGNGNSARMLKSTAGTDRISPVNGLAAARLRSSPSFGENVVGCLTAGNLVSRTGRVSGTWSQVKLADNTTGWISTNQLN